MQPRERRNQGPPQKHLLQKTRSQGPPSSAVAFVTRWRWPVDNGPQGNKVPPRCSLLQSCTGVAGIGPRGWEPHTHGLMGCRELGRKEGPWRTSLQGAVVLDSSSLGTGRGSRLWLRPSFESRTGSVPPLEPKAGSARRGSHSREGVVIAPQNGL